jgi:hypothetical protein
MVEINRDLFIDLEQYYSTRIFGHPTGLNLILLFPIHLQSLIQH